MDKKQQKLKKLLTFADDSGLAIFDELQEINEGLSDFNKTFKWVDLSELTSIQGEQGIPGKDGEVGPVGPRGLQGSQGPKGEAGRDGYDGFDGKDGAPGKDGKDGKDGSPDTGKDIKSKLESLVGEARLDASAIKNLPSMVGKLARDGYPYGLPQPAGAMTYRLNGTQVGRGNILNIQGPGITTQTLDDGITYIITGGPGDGTVTQIDTTGPITGGPITTTGTIGITQSDGSTDGYLSSIDWNTFNDKLSKSLLEGHFFVGDASDEAVDAGTGMIWSDTFKSLTINSTGGGAIPLVVTSSGNTTFGVTSASGESIVNLLASGSNHSYLTFNTDIIIGQVGSLGGLVTPFFKVDNTGDLRFYSYPSTRDDSGTFTPVSFLYTDTDGNVLESPISGLAPSGTPYNVAFYGGLGTLTDDNNFHYQPAGVINQEFFVGFGTVPYLRVPTLGTPTTFSIGDGDTVNGKQGNSTGLYIDDVSKFAVIKGLYGGFFHTPLLKTDFANGVVTIGANGVANNTLLTIDDPNQLITLSSNILASAYPNTRDDTGSTAIINVLYTDASGNVLSAPTSALPTVVPALTATQIAFGDGSNLMTSDSNFTWDTSFSILRVLASGNTFFQVQAGVNMLSGDFTNSGNGFYSETNWDQQFFRVHNDGFGDYFSVDGATDQILLNAGQKVRRTSFSDNDHTVALSDYYDVLMGATSDRTFTLPTASGTNGKIYILKNNYDSAANMLVVGTGGDTVEGQPTLTVFPGDSVIFISDGVSNWEAN